MQKLFQPELSGSAKINPIFTSQYGGALKSQSAVRQENIWIKVNM